MEGHKLASSFSSINMLQLFWEHSEASTVGLNSFETAASKGEEHGLMNTLIQNL